MSKMSNFTLSTSNVDPRYTANTQLKEKIEQLRLANQKANSSGQSEPAYTVEISDEARALSEQWNQNAGADATDSSSLFTKAGRTEVSQQYDQIFESLLANYEEGEALQRFDDFMVSEGYERSATTNTSITAPSSDRSIHGQNLSTHSHIEATVVDGKDHILAATWATYAASSTSGSHTYQKKISDSFDLAADTRTIVKGNNMDALNGGQGTDPQSEALWSRLDEAMEEALTTGGLIDSTVTEEEFIKARESEKNTTSSELVLTKIEKYKDPTNGEKSENYAFTDDQGNKIIGTLAELKAKFTPTDNAPQSEQVKSQSEHMKKIMDYIASR